MSRQAFALLFLGLYCASGLAADFARAAGDYPAIQESLRYLPPNIRFYELDRLGLMPRSPASTQVESSGLLLRGKWGAGPCVKVTGRDSLVFLSRGSEVVAMNCADTNNPRVLSYIQVNGLVSRSVLVGNRLYVGSTGSDPKYIDVFDVADPANPRRLGACRDTGYTLSVCNGYAYVADRWGLYVVDVRDPTSPHHEASRGSDVISVKARGNICCATTDNPNNPGELRFTILDVRVPSNPVPLGGKDGCGGYDIDLDDSLAFVSGYYTGGHEFQVISIRDSQQPRLVAQAGTPGENNGVWANLAYDRAFVADRAEGLAIFNMTSLANPILDTALLDAGWAYDVAVRGGLVVVADDWSGVKILDARDQTNPIEIASVDTALSMPATHSVWLADSFVFAGWDRLDYFRSIWVGDSAEPQMAGGCPSLQTWPEDMVVEDSFAYLACRLRFYVINVARPREPVLVGSCVLSGTGRNIALGDTVAFVAMGSGGLACINVSNPAVPSIIGTWGGRSGGVALADTIAYVAGPYTSLVSLDVADPTAPRVIDSLWLTDTLWWNDVAVNGSLAYVGGERVLTVDISDPVNLRVRGTLVPPYLVQRLFYAAPYIYAACYEAGVCVLETVQVGMSEELSRARLVERPGTVCPNPASQFAAVRAGPDLESAVMRDVLGRLVRTFKPSGAVFTMDLTGLRPGLYFIELRYNTGRRMEKLIKQ